MTRRDGELQGLADQYVKEWDARAQRSARLALEVGRSATSQVEEMLTADDPDCGARLGGGDSRAGGKVGGHGDGFASAHWSSGSIERFNRTMGRFYWRTGRGALRTAGRFQRNARDSSSRGLRSLRCFGRRGCR